MNRGCLFLSMYHCIHDKSKREPQPLARINGSSYYKDHLSFNFDHPYAVASVLGYIFVALALGYIYGTNYEKMGINALLHLGKKDNKDK